MKVNLPERPMLSIGLIVKNEEKHLENCLEALAPLRECLSCEVVIADTGSTDRTIEIAETYADVFFHFEWINDFAAARNAVIDRTTGEWVLILDADEYLDADISELQDFFRSSQHKNYFTASVYVRNYQYSEEKKSEKDEYSQNLSVRMFRNLEQIRYTGKIHESLPVVEPALNLTHTVLHHYGYYFKNREELKEKMETRNMTLIREELEKNPNNLRMLCHAVDSCVENKEEREFYLKCSIEEADKQPENKFAPVSYRNRAFFYSSTGEWDKAEQYARKMKEKFPDSLYTKIDASYILAWACYITGNKEETIIHAELYLEHGRMLEESGEGHDELSYSSLKFPMSGEGPHLSRCLLSGALFALEEWQKSVDVVEQIDVSYLAESNFLTIMNQLFESSSFCNTASIFQNFYQGTLAKLPTENEGTLKKCEIFEKKVDAALQEAPTEENLAVLKALSTIPSERIVFRLASLAAKAENETITEELKQLMESVEDWASAPLTFYGFSIRYHTLLPEAAVQVGSQKLLSGAAALSERFPDFAEKVLDMYEKQPFPNTICALLWCLDCLAAAVWNIDKIPEERRNGAIDLFAECAEIYLSSVYNPELLNEDDLSILPVIQRFAWYLLQAKAEYKNGNPKGYVAFLRKGVQIAPGFAKIVEFLLNQFKEENFTDEFYLLGKQIKERIHRLIDLGNTVEAGNLLKQLEQILPDDSEIEELKEKCASLQKMLEATEKTKENVYLFS